MIELTAPQRRYLNEIREAGVRTYNGRARRPLEALRNAGLIQFAFELVPQLHGRFTERYTARLDENFCEACADGMDCPHQVCVA